MGNIYICIHINLLELFFFSHYVDIGIDVTRFTRSNTNMRIDIIIYYIRVIPHIQVDYDFFF